MERSILARTTTAFAFLAFAAALPTPAGASHTANWDVYQDLNHDTPYVGFHTASPACEAECGPMIDTAEKRAELLVDASKKATFLQCTAEHARDAEGGCQPLRALPPSPEPQHCPLQVADQNDYEARCEPFTTVAENFGEASCCLQWELEQRGWRGYQLFMGPYDFPQGQNDSFTRAFIEVPNAANLDADGSTYEYMVGFEFWQYRGSHHFILNDILGEFNDPDQPRGDCSQYEGDQRTRCEHFDSRPEACPADDVQADRGCGLGQAGTEMRAIPLAGSPGPAYFPVPYPDGVGIKLSRDHIFLLDHHTQNWYTPQVAQSWINIYTKKAKADDGSENVEKEAHVFFDGSGSAFYIPPHTIAKAQGLWVAPRNIELYGLTGHSHKRNTLFTADMIGPDGQSLQPIRDYPLSDPRCGGMGEDGLPPMHLYESTDWSDHEQCPFWLEDDGDNDREGALFIRQGEGIRYECWFNNGILPEQMARGTAAPSTGDPTADSTIANAKAGAQNAMSVFPARTLAYQEVPVEPRDAFGDVVRGKFSCEETVPLVGGAPFANMPPNAPFISNKPCTPDILKDQLPHEDYDTPEELQALVEGGPAEECVGSINKGGYYTADLTGKCIPASIAFAETEDDEMCILLGLYAFADTDDDGGVPDDLNDDLVPTGTNGPLGENGVDRLPTDVGR